METMTLRMDVSKDLFTLLGFSRPQAVAAMQEFSVLGLYRERKVSAGKAAELLGMGLREFVRLLARKGIPYFDYSEEELREEFRTLDEWQRHPGETL